MIKRGFTLVEILVALVIVSVGMLALGSFYTSMISQEGIAQERIIAVHMAEQLIEDWQNTNTPPTPNCIINGVAAGVLPINILPTTNPMISISNCRVNNGISVAFTIILTETPAKAPLPVSHPNNPSLNVTDSTGVGMYPLLTLSDASGNVIAGSPQVKVRSVKVSWIHSKIQSVYLTHITRYMP
ncbi:MAG: type II secretion system protein [Mariprofundaceae bacterium]|nr:type II secretion system protein [Mariprofundaceae bacterium]